MRHWHYLCIAVVGLLAGCANGQVPAPPATLTLIPATETPIPTQTPPPPTPDTSAIVPGTPPASQPTNTGSGPQQDTLLETDPVAAELVALAQRRLANALGLPLRRIRLVEVEARRWSDSSLGCPQPEQPPVPLEIDGYRIVLSAGDTTYIYHTDFDRLVTCPAELDDQPDATATPS